MGKFTKFHKKSVCKRHRGAVLVISMMFVLIFSALAVSMAAMSGVNLQISSNHHKINSALCAAQSGLECAKYLVSKANFASTSTNTVSTSEANTVWTQLCQHIQTTSIAGQSVPAAARFIDSIGSGDEIIVPSVNFGSTDENFTIRFYRYDSSPLSIKIQSTGSDDTITRQIKMDMAITKDSEVLRYAIASNGRMIVTGDSTIDGPIFSTWDKPEWQAPVETTSGTIVNGSINTILTLDELLNNGVQMETLDANDNPVFDEYGNRVYSPQDKIQGYHKGINYDQSCEAMPGMDEDDYDTSMYESTCSDIPTSGTIEIEYFPHQPGNYEAKKDSWNYQYYRHTYENQTFTNARLPRGRNALFKNCTFEEVLFIDSKSYTGSKSYCNNVRFENCQFNGIIVTDIPKNSSIQWVQNCLYFTGGATFENNSSFQEATILAPNFNVNLGNTLEVEEEGDNILTGAIIGGIVDIRGNAQINGTIISMYDASQHSSGYVTNIGFADDGGSEGGVPEDIGVIHVTCSPEQLLPSGITSPIVIRPLQNTYCEEY